MLKSGLVYFAVFLLISCQSYNNKSNDTIEERTNSDFPKLENTKWQHKINESCINLLKFYLDSTTLYYSCEMEDTFYGKYFISGDTLHIEEYPRNSLSSNEDMIWSDYPKFKIIVIGEKLKFIEKFSYHIPKEIWIKDNFDFDEDFLFEQVK